MDGPGDLMVTCGGCGRRNNSGANFCQNCGARLAGKPDAPRTRLIITERASERLRAIRSGSPACEGQVLRIGDEPDGFSLSFGPRREGDCLISSGDAELVYVSSEAGRLLQEKRWVLHCIDGRLVIYAQEDE